MINIKVVLFSLVAIAAVSCSSNQNSEEQTESQKNTYNIELVNNEKWGVNDEMMVHIKNMESDIEKVEEAETPDYEELGQELDKNIELLTSSCTMSGKSHDELHKWLVPFIGLVADFNEVTDKKGHFPAIQESMIEFNTYFK